MNDILKKILATKREEIETAKARVSLTTLRGIAEAVPATRNFAGAIQARVSRSKHAVIAEIKKASPSKGVIRSDFNPAVIAADYAANGATCLSVLTDEQYFQGHADYLIAARNACTLPVLRKDFMIDEYQILEARAMGADCILLIVAALSLDTMKDLESLAQSLGMSVLVESHDAAELDLALKLNTPLIGINNRSLRSFDVSLETTIQLLSHIPADRTVITESGILASSDVAQMRTNGVHAYLVGEACMRKPSPGQELRQLFSSYHTLS